MHLVMSSAPYCNVLEKPGTHDIGGLFGKNTAFVFRRAVICTEETQVLIELKLKLPIEKHTVGECACDLCCVESV